MTLCLVGCGKGPPPTSPVRPVKAMKVGDVAALARRTFPGRSKATEEVTLSFRVSGPLVALPVNVGDQVKKGDILAQIDPRDFQVRLRSAEGDLGRARAELQAMKTGARPEEVEKLKAAVQRAEAGYKRWQGEYDRIMDLDKKGAATTIEVERTREERQRAESELSRAREDLRIGQAGARKEDILAKEAEIKTLEAAVDSAKDQLGYTHLKAPFDGAVAVKYVENFQTVQAREPVLRLLDTSKIEVTVSIPENLISLAQYVTDAYIKFDAVPGREFKAKIKEIGTEASQTTRTYPVTLIMDQPKDAKILPGYAARVRGEGKLPEEARTTGLEVPTSALLADQGDKTLVWVVDEKAKTVKQREVTAGRLTSRGMIVQGLSPGEMVVTAGVHYLEEGQKVRILADTTGEVTQ